MSSPLKPLHVALYHTLTNNAPLMVLVSGVYDHVPASAVFPYLVLDDSNVLRWDLLGANAYQTDLALDIYSRQGGRKEIMEITDALQTLLHMQPLTVSGFEVALAKVMEIDTERQNDGITTHARVKLRCYMTEAS